MITVGITGGIGSGKSTVASFFKELGMPVFVADDEAKKLMNTNPALQEKIMALFGIEAYKNDELNRPFLAKKVFENKSLLDRLNSIVHPAVAEAFQAWLAIQKSPIVGYEAAIIFEKNKQDSFDYVVLVTASKETRIKRLQQRDNSSVEEIENRMNNQWSDEKKIKLADFVIKNENMTKTKKKVIEIYKYLNNIHNF